MPLTFDESKAKFSWKNQNLLFTKASDGRLKLTLPDGRVQFADSIRDTMHYARSRRREMVYAAGTHRFESTPMGAKWDYGSVSFDGPLIPETYYMFQLDESQLLIVYKFGEFYVIQNPTGLKATAKDGRIILVLDANANGAYFDELDFAGFVKPGSKRPDFPRNTWLSQFHLRQNCFIEISDSLGKLWIDSPMGPFYKEQSKGSISFLAVPKGGLVIINGMEFAPKSGKPIPAEYGYYKYAMAIPGKMNTEGEFIVSSNNPAVSLPFKTGAPAGWLTFKTGYLGQFKVNAKSSTGTTIVYRNPHHLDLLPGPWEIEVVFDLSNPLCSVKRNYEIKAGQVTMVDVNKEAYIDLLDKMKASGDTGPNYEYLLKQFNKKYPDSIH